MNTLYDPLINNKLLNRQIQKGISKINIIIVDLTMKTDKRKQLMLSLQNKNNNNNIYVVCLFKNSNKTISEARNNVGIKAIMVIYFI